MRMVILYCIPVRKEPFGAVVSELYAVKIGLQFGSQKPCHHQCRQTIRYSCYEYIWQAYMRIHIHMYTHINIHIHMHTHMRIHIHMYAYMHTHIHTYKRIHIHRHTTIVSPPSQFFPSLLDLGHFLGLLLYLSYSFALDASSALYFLVDSGDLGGG
jgi:hypothetical protein